MCLILGQGNFIIMNEVILITNTSSIFFKRLIQDKKNLGQVVDLTSRKSLNCMILTTSSLFLTSSSSKNLICNATHVLQKRSLKK